MNDDAAAAGDVVEGADALWTEVLPFHPQHGRSGRHRRERAEQRQGRRRRRDRRHGPAPEGAELEAEVFVDELIAGFADTPEIVKRERWIREDPDRGAGAQEGTVLLAEVAAHTDPIVQAKLALDPSAAGATATSDGPRKQGRDLERAYVERRSDLQRCEAPLRRTLAAGPFDAKQRVLKRQIDPERPRASRQKRRRRLRRRLVGLGGRKQLRGGSRRDGHPRRDRRERPDRSKPAALHGRPS